MFTDENMWNSLPMKEKAQMMRVAIANGMTSLPEIRDAYNKFAKGGNLQKQQDEYEAWLRNEAKLNSSLWGMSYEDTLEQMQNDDAYDYRRFYELQKRYPNNPEYQRDLDGNAHYNDVGKSVYHPTASKGSYYSGRRDPKYNPTGAVFGDWLDDGHEYRMSEDMLRAGRSPYDTFNYLGVAEDQGARLRDERGYMFQDYREPDGTFMDSVLPAVTVTPDNKHAFGGNLYGDGGYAPSEQLKKDIAKWEGSEMKRNAPFSEMTRQFNATIPAEVRSKLSQSQLDALYSYGYNAGMGRLKERVLPMLNSYVQGKASNEDVQRSMWASRDNELRGLTSRRNWEREKFGGTFRTTFTGNGGNPLGNHMDISQLLPGQQYYDNLKSQIEIPQMQQPETTEVDPSTVYTPPVIDQSLLQKPVEPVVEVPEIDPKQEQYEGMRRLSTVLGMMGQNPLTSTGYGSTSGAPGLLSLIGKIYN